MKKRLLKLKRERNPDFLCGRLLNKDGGTIDWEMESMYDGSSASTTISVIHFKSNGFPSPSFENSLITHKNTLLKKKAAKSTHFNQVNDFLETKALPN